MKIIHEWVEPGSVVWLGEVLDSSDRTSRHPVSGSWLRAPANVRIHPTNYPMADYTRNCATTQFVNMSDGNCEYEQCPEVSLGSTAELQTKICHSDKLCRVCLLLTSEIYWQIAEFTRML